MTTVCRGLMAVTLLLVVASSVSADSRRVVWYLDGSQVTLEANVTGGYHELVLPASMKPGSLRVKPLDGGKIDRVEVVPVKPGKAVEKELARIAGQKDDLSDRLRALEVKEEIFKATAKSQGSKAPRRTRTNPEPLTAIRQGTDFAISRLEDVYRLRRRIGQELKELDTREARLREQGNMAGKTARVWMRGKRGHIQASYLRSGEGWQPLYDIRLAAATATVTLNARLPYVTRGESIAVVPQRLADATNTQGRPVAGNLSQVSVYQLPLVTERLDAGLQPAVRVTLRNDSGTALPAGDSSAFLNDEYLGQSLFPGAKPGESCELSYGSQ